MVRLPPGFEDTKPARSVACICSTTAASSRVSCSRYAGSCLASCTASCTLNVCLLAAASADSTSSSNAARFGGATAGSSAVHLIGTAVAQCTPTGPSSLNAPGESSARRPREVGSLAPAPTGGCGGSTGRAWGRSAAARASSEPCGSFGSILRMTRHASLAPPPLYWRRTPCPAHYRAATALHTPHAACISLGQGCGAAIRHRAGQLVGKG